MYTFEVQVLSYKNPTSQRVDRTRSRCCDGMGDTNCNNQCDNIFVFCLRNSVHSQSDITENCPLGLNKTNQFENSDTIVFSPPFIDEEAGVPNPLVFTGDVWPVSYLCHYYLHTSLTPHLFCTES